MQKYKRLKERSYYLLAKYKELSSKNEDNKYKKYLIEDDCIGHFFECEGYKTYEDIAKFCKEKGFKRAFDIGCAYGHQSECFIDTDVEYIGIEQTMWGDFWNSDRYNYINGTYPFSIDTLDKDIAVSVLCLTWNCYLSNGEETLKAQLEQLSKDFKHCLLYLAEDKIPKVLEYYKFHSKVKDKLYYFSNEVA